MKSKAFAVCGVAIAAVGLAGCSSLGQSSGFARTTPDEFNVVTKPPLVVPPEYALRPPATGAVLPAELQNQGNPGRTILFGQDLGQSASQGERSLVTAAGAAAADPTVRTQVDFENAQIMRKPNSIVSQIFDFVPLSNTSTDADGNPLDAEAEAARLRQIDSVNSATGGGTVVIEYGEAGFKLPGT